MPPSSLFHAVFRVVKQYEIFSALLHIEPAPNNGTMGSLNTLLVPEARSDVSKSQGDGTQFRTDICKYPSEAVFDSRSKAVCSSCMVSCYVFFSWEENECK